LLLLPIAAVIIITGVFGFLYGKENLLNEWREGAILKLQRAAHHIDMRLDRPIQWIVMFHQTARGMGAYAIQQWILDQLKALDGVSAVSLQWIEGNETAEPSSMSMMRRGGKDQTDMGARRGMRFHQARIAEVTSPRYDAKTGKETVTLISNLKNESGELVGRLKVDVGFQYLMQDIIRLGWWQGDNACLVDNAGYYLARADGMVKKGERLGQNTDPLGKTLLKGISETPPRPFLDQGIPHRKSLDSIGSRKRPGLSSFLRRVKKSWPPSSGIACTIRSAGSSV
jgi:hypothetical protein